MGEREDHEAGQESVALGALHGSEQFNKTEPNYEALLLGRQWELTDGDPEDDPIKDVPKREADVVRQPGKGAEEEGESGAIFIEIIMLPGKPGVQRPAIQEVEE